MEEAELEDSQGGSPITGIEVAEINKQLYSCRMGVRPEFLKNIPLKQYWGDGPLLKKGDQKMCTNYMVTTHLSRSGKVYSRVPELREINQTLESRGAMCFLSWT